VLENVRTFIRVRDDHAAGGGNRCRITFQLTFLEANVAELATSSPGGLDLGVDRVKGHHLWAHFDAIRRAVDASQPRGDPPLEPRRPRAREARRRPALPMASTCCSRTSSCSTKTLPRTSRRGPVSVLGQEAWVSAEGRFDPCCAPDAQRRTLGELGNLHDRGLMEIWNGDAYRRARGGLPQSFAVPWLQHAPARGVTS
jgi:hypothetical protein